ncbi:toll-like receptor 13 [Ptychodera flava]|uniref:toll-like receptor 13 n=1 Tax=Ptychodera flava TaxID=63121 RepID=UPI003969DD17
MLHGLGNLTRLDLTFTGLGNVALKKELFEPLKSLEELLLGNNCYKSVEEDTFDHLVNLRMLNLSYAMIEYLPSKIFQKLNKLEALYLSPTRLKEIPNDALAFLSLKRLYLGGNFKGSVSLGENFNNNTKFDVFAMNGCYPQNSITVSCIRLKITNTTFFNLKVKKFAYHQHQGLDHEGVKNLLSFPPKCEDLYIGWVDGLMDHSLSPALFNGWHSRMHDITGLRLIQLGIVGIKNNSFSNFKNLKVLDLRNNCLINKLVEESAFYGLEKLKTLDLSSNSLSTLPGLNVEISSRNMSMLSELRLSNNELHILNKDSFNRLPYLETLDLSNTHIGDPSLETFYNLPELKYLNLKGNTFRNLTGIVSVLSKLPKLQKLILSNNPFVEGQYRDSICQSRFHKLKYLELSNLGADLRVLSNAQRIEEIHLINPEGFNVVVSWKKNQLYLPRLRVLFISGSQISFDKEMFSTMPYLTKLELPNNRIDILDWDSITGLENLTHLDLSDNDIKEISGSAQNLPKLQTLLLSGNKLSDVEESAVNRKYLPSLQRVDFSKNSFVCSCDLVRFKNWIMEDRLVEMLGYQTYTCSAPSNPHGVMYLKDFNPNTLMCQSLLPVYLAVGLSISAALLVVVVAVAVHYRWHIKYAIFLIQLKAKGYVRIPDPEKKYDAFISFNSGDEEWVQYTLVPYLEGNCTTNFKVCVHYKDFIPGKSIIENILDSIENSRKTILVLSPNFVKSEWCHFEMQMAHHRLFEDRRDVVILLLLESIPNRDTPRMLRKLLLRKSYITWPKEEHGPARQLFWAQLESALKRPSLVNHVQEI